MIRRGFQWVNRPIKYRESNEGIHFTGGQLAVNIWADSSPIGGLFCRRVVGKNTKRIFKG